MNVYLWPSQSVMKNAYIGEVIEISSDLRWATLAELQAKWWNGIAYNNQYTLNSTWLHTPNISNSYCYLYKQITDLSSRHKITIKLTWYATRNWSNENYAYNSFFFSVISKSLNPYYESNANSLFWCYNASWTTSSLKTWIGVFLNGSYSNLSWWNYWNTAGNVSQTFDIDLSTGVVNYSVTSPTNYSTTATLTASQLENIKSWWYVWVCFWPKDRSNNPVLYTVDLTVE
jgi:hypothetical protein